MGKFWNRSRWDWFYRFSFTAVMWCHTNLLAVAVIVITVTLSFWAAYRLGRRLGPWSRAWSGGYRL